jgi:hypothetical protein
VPKALSRPQQRYALEATALTAKNLSTMCTLRGNGRSGASQGAYSIFADGSAEGGPAEVVRSSFESKVSAIDEIDEEVEPQGNKGQATPSRKRRVLGERDPNLPTETVEDRKVPVGEQGCVDLAMEYAGNIHIVLILNHLDQTIVPPCSQELQRLDCAITQKVPLV